jgi:DNA-binding NtrC family response regulator
MEPAENQRTILVVEDEALIRLAVVELLKDAGYRVIEAGNSADALTLLAANSQISVVLTDVDMPGRLDGLGLVGLVQRDRPSIRSIVVSGSTSAKDAISAGAAAFVPKPYLAKAIVGAVFETLQAA